MKNRGMVIGVVVCAVMGASTLTGAIPRASAKPIPAIQQAPPPMKAPLPPLPPGGLGPGPNAEPSPEAKKLAANISAYATAKCGGQDSSAAPDCWAKSLWDATQCPPEDATANKDAAAKKESAAPSEVCVPGGPGFEYDVASIKEHKNDGNFMSMVGGTPDGFRSVNMTMQNTVINAYSTGLQLQITGAPGWFTDARYDIEAKFVPEVGEALSKLSSDDRGFVRRYMMQQVLKERTNLKAHVDTKEVPTYDLVIGKNGPMLKAADPNAKDNGNMRMQNDQGKVLITAKGMGMQMLARNLSGAAGRPVFDKTGLTGTYDITLEFAREQTLSTGVPAAAGGAAGNVPDAPEPANGPSIMAALEEQLGLKLAPSRGPMQVVVIEHVDKPDVN